MLTVARESRGLTQTALAQRLGLRQASISKFETGLLAVSPDHHERVSRILDYPPSFFEQSERMLGFGTPCVYHRKRATLPSPTLRQVQAQVNILRIQLARFLQGVELDAEREFPQLDIDVYRDPEEVASLVRSTWGLPAGPVANVVDAIERAGGLVVTLDFGTQKLDAVSQWAPGLPAMIFVNRQSPGDRMRFTLTHELAHLIMHRRPSKDMEGEADRFAAEFLMPRREVRVDLVEPVTIAKLAGLKPYWKTSIAALARRARDVGAIDDNRYRRLFTQLGAFGYRKVEPNPIPREQPQLVSKILDVYQGELGYTLEEMSDLARMSLDEFKVVYSLQARARPVVPLRIVTTPSA